MPNFSQISKVKWTRFFFKSSNLRLLLLKADVSGVSPSSERLEELWVVCAFLCRKWSYAIGWEYGEEKTRINHYNIQSILY